MAKGLNQIVDTNIIIRFLVGDEKSQQNQARKYFKEAQLGKRKLIIKSIVVAEACFVLESFYKKTRPEISDAFQVFLSQKWLKVDERGVLLLLWQFYLKNLHFVDSYILSWSKVHNASVLSFDQKLLKK